MRIDIELLKKSFDAFKGEVDTALTTIGNKLEAEEYAAAAADFNVLSQRVASTNLAVRNVLVKGKYIDAE